MVNPAGHRDDSRSWRVRALVIAHNVNNFHQAAGVGLRCIDPREKWSPIMTACRPARILGQAESAAAPRDGSKMMFRSRTVQITILAAGLASALITATAGDSAHGEGTLDASYTISFARIAVGEITATAVFGESEYAMSARRVLVASSKRYWWTAKPRSPHRAPSKAVIRCRRLSPLRSSRTPKPRM